MFSTLSHRVLFLLLVFSVGCKPASDPLSPPAQSSLNSPTSTASSISTPAPEAVSQQDSELVVALTNQRLDGNRLAIGSGGMPAEPLDIHLLGKPNWVVAAPLQNDSVWVVTIESGQVQAFQIEGQAVNELDLNVSMLPPGMPPVLRGDGGIIELLSPIPDASAFTHPVSLINGMQAYIDVRGQLRLLRQNDNYALAVNALPDARILSDQAGRLLFLSNPTEQYPHGVLGDQLEATSITLVDIMAEPYVVREIQVDPGDVFEGIAPIWVDLNGDGSREIIVTQSNADAGARIVIYREDGTLFASGEPIGQGFRWRHQLAVGQFIAGGSQEIAVIRTPHLGGVLEIYALVNGQLEIQSMLAGYSSHQLGSRNLDSALAADFNGDGKVEIVVPDQFQTTLAGIQVLDNSLQTVWEAPLGGRLSTNLTAVTLPDGKLALGVGQANKILRLWFPK